MRLFQNRPADAPFDGNPKAQAALGISPRELAVLQELAAGRSNKEIAIRLAVSPNTVKTHTARLFGKLGAKRRTDAINRARELGLLP
jgi:ATP/maltotriose-dependent transcriptional regulator MalT